MSSFFHNLELMRRDAAAEIKEELDLLELNLAMLGCCSTFKVFDNNVVYYISKPGEGIIRMESIFYIFGTSKLRFVYYENMITEKNKVQIESFENGGRPDWISSIREMNRYCSTITF